MQVFGGTPRDALIKKLEAEMTTKEYAKALRKIHELNGTLKRSDQKLLKDSEIISNTPVCNCHYSEWIHARNTLNTANEFVAWWLQSMQKKVN